MMYRCGWATKEGQEVVLALWIRRSGFDEALAYVKAVSEPFGPLTEAQWQHLVAYGHRRRDDGTFGRLPLGCELAAMATEWPAVKFAAIDAEACGDLAPPPCTAILALG